MSPTHPYLNPLTTLTQRAQYQKPGLGRWYWDFKDRHALSHIGEAPILDLGCGEGITLQKLAGQRPSFPMVVGLDLDPTNATICRNHGLPFIRGDVAALPFRTASIGTVLCLEVIEHLENPGKAIKEIRRVLRDDGRLVLIFPNDVVFWLARMVTLRLREAREDPHHVQQWTPGKISRLLQKQGFAICHQRGLPFDSWPWALHYLVVARPAEPCD